MNRQIGQDTIKLIIKELLSLLNKMQIDNIDDLVDVDLQYNFLIKVKPDIEYIYRLIQKIE